MNMRLTSTTFFIPLVLVISSLGACSKSATSGAPDNDDIRSALSQQTVVAVDDVSDTKCLKKGKIDTGVSTNDTYACTYTVTSGDAKVSGDAVFVKVDGQWQGLMKN
jgi:hypothetical protein